MGKLNQKKIRDLTKPGRYGDGNGLYLFIRQGGSRQWILRTTVAGRRVDIGLGSSGVVTLAEAREIAQSHRKLAKEGVDPVYERRKRKSIPTYEEAALTVVEQLKPTWKNAKHSDQWINTQRTSVFPVIGQLKVGQVTSGHILAILGPIWLSKGETARRIKQRMESVFDWAKAAGHRAGDSPLEGVLKALPKQDRRQVHHAAMPWVEIPSFVIHLQQRDATSARALEFLILTAARSGEVRNAPWKEFDLPSRTWIVPAHRMKMEKEHRVPLADQAVALLERCKNLGSELVFPSDNPKRAMSDMVFSKLFERMGVTGITAHGFRSSFRDWVSETDSAPREIAEIALAHAVGDATEKAYARSDLLERRRELMQKWAAFIYQVPYDKDVPKDGDETGVE